MLRISKISAGEMHSSTERTLTYVVSGTVRVSVGSTARIAKPATMFCKGTVLQGTKIPIRKWFVSVSIIINAKKSVSSCQLGRDPGINRKSAWYMIQRIQAVMAIKNDILFRGVIKADETYLGGRPRCPNRREAEEPAPRG